MEKITKFIEKKLISENLKQNMIKLILFTGKIIIFPVSSICLNCAISCVCLNNDQIDSRLSYKKNKAAFLNFKRSLSIYKNGPIFATEPLTLMGIFKNLFSQKKKIKALGFILFPIGIYLLLKFFEKKKKNTYIYLSDEELLKEFLKKFKNKDYDSIDWEELHKRGLLEKFFELLNREEKIIAAKYFEKFLKKRNRLIAFKIFLLSWFLMALLWIIFLGFKFFFRTAILIFKVLFEWLKLRLAKLWTLYKLTLLRRRKKKMSKAFIAFLKRIIRLKALFGSKFIDSLLPIEEIINSIIKGNPYLIEELSKLRAFFGFKGLSLLPPVSEIIEYIIKNGFLAKEDKIKNKIIRDRMGILRSTKATLVKVIKVAPSYKSLVVEHLLSVLNKDRQIFINNVLPKILPFVPLSTLPVEEIVASLLETSPFIARRRILKSLFFAKKYHTLLEYLEYMRKYFGSISKSRPLDALASVIVIVHMIKRQFII